MAQTTEVKADTESAEMVNEVRLVGRVSQPPAEKELPSGDLLVTVLVTVPRRASAAGTARRGSSDPLECVAWTARVRRTVMGFREHDVVEVHGGLRRRFFRTAGGLGSRVEVEVTRARVVRRART